MKSFHNPHYPKESENICEFCESNIQSKAKSILKSKPMHMVTINNNTMCDTGHLHVSSLAYSKHRHHQNYKKSLGQA